MSKRIPIFIDGKQLEIEITDFGSQGPINRSFNILVNVTAEDETERVSLIFSDLVLHMWFGSGLNESELFEKLEAFSYQVLPYLISDSSTNRFFFHRDENVEKQEAIEYLKAEKSIIETANLILFGTKKPTNNQVRKSILTVCYSIWQTDPFNFADINDFKKMIPVSDVDLQKNIDYLVQKYLVKGSPTTAGYMHVKITSEGIDLFENPHQFNKVFEIRLEQQTNNISGDYIAPNIIGDQNFVSIKSNIENSFNELLEKLSDKGVKPEHIELVDKLKTEVLKDKKNFDRISEIIKTIKLLPSQVNKHILSHPIISQVIANLLTQNPEFFTKLI